MQATMCKLGKDVIVKTYEGANAEWKLGVIVVVVHFHQNGKYSHSLVTWANVGLYGNTQIGRSVHWGARGAEQQAAIELREACC